MQQSLHIIIYTSSAIYPSILIALLKKIIFTFISNLPSAISINWYSYYLQLFKVIKLN